MPHVNQRRTAPRGKSRLFILLSFCGVFFCASLFSFLYSSINFTSAPESTSATNVSIGLNVPVVLTLSAASSVVIPSPDVANSSISSADLSATVSTNNPVGYNLFLNMREELATGHDNTCLRHSAESTTACASVDSARKIVPVSTAILAANQWGVSLTTPWATWAAVPSATSTALTVDTYPTNTNSRTTTIKTGAKVDMEVVAGTYSGTVQWSAIPTPIPTITISSISPDYGDPGDTVTVAGTNFNSLTTLYIGELPCLDMLIQSNTSLTCTVPDLELGRYQLAVADVIGASYIPLNSPHFIINDPNYQGEIWGFSMDTTIATAVNFRATAPTALEVDFGNGTWTTFAQGATIAGTATPSTGAGDLARIRIRPVDPTAAGWLPANATSDRDYLLTSNMDAIITVDYPLTTLAISSKDGAELVVQGSTKTQALFGEATNLVKSVSFSNTPGYTVVAVGDDFLYLAHYGNASLKEPVDLSALEGWEVASIGGWFLNDTHHHNDSLEQTVDLSPLANWGITHVSRCFLGFLHYNSASISQPIDLSPLANWNISSIDSSFLRFTHGANISLEYPIDLSPLANWRIDSVSGDFLGYTHDGNTSLISAIDLAPLRGWNATSIGNSFLSGTHRDNTSLTLPISLAPLRDWNVTSVGTNFMYTTHHDNTNLLDISSFKLPTWAMGKMANTSNAMYQTFYLSSATTTIGGEPTFMDTLNTPISADGTPSSNRQTYTGRSSINPENISWK